MEISDLAARFASGAAMDSLPPVIDVRTTVPPNPPEAVQLGFVGLSFDAAFAEADAFVSAIASDLAALGKPPLESTARVLDFGSGWGRISRVLLTRVAPHRLFAADVDPEMTALVNSTLPGVNALTVTPAPPTVLGDGVVDVATAFSVFSHLSGPAHEAWAAEFGRVVAVGGVVAITVLGAEFIDLVAGSQEAVRAGTANEFSTHMASVFDDIEATRRGYAADEVQFGATGGGGVRTSDYYGWAVASHDCVVRTWGAAGFRLRAWHPVGELFPQALAVLERVAPVVAEPPTPRERVVRGARRAVHPVAVGARRWLPDPARRALSSARRVVAGTRRPR
jgi:hypothetical protein